MKKLPAKKHNPKVNLGIRPEELVEMFYERERESLDAEGHGNISNPATTKLD